LAFNNIIIKYQRRFIKWRHTFFDPHTDLRRLDEVHPGRGHPLHPHHRPQRHHDLQVSQQGLYIYYGGQKKLADISKGQNLVCS